MDRDRIKKRKFPDGDILISERTAIGVSGFKFVIFTLTGNQIL